MGFKEFTKLELEIKPIKRLQTRLKILIPIIIVVTLSKVSIEIYSSTRRQVHSVILVSLPFLHIKQYHHLPLRCVKCE